MKRCACKKPKPWTMECATFDATLGRYVDHESCELCNKCGGIITDWHPTTEQA